MKKILFALSIFCACCITFINANAQQNVNAQQHAEPVIANMAAKLDAPAPDGIRPGGTLNQELPAPKIPRDRISAEPANRNYPEQPPMIPHNIRGYQIDKNFNMCLSCHSRSASPQTGAPMVSITHFYDRDGQALAAVSPRRYFCVQCHLPQADVKPARTNNYQSIDALLQNSSGE
ncbi:nitrate reductase cytochrome c-type subunit [Cellvibrio sp. pealriver]|uniref:nitrate reductase cytochrome c-type subunit n=1 Tax=Cellvibrio sp. pealriver TaxID=1622269 RepID=UPI001E408CB9|nr:nitrate reductase cytochrome c-type subunit [Cellvibrio sp. pealriver]